MKQRTWQGQEKDSMEGYVGGLGKVARKTYVASHG